VAKQINVKGIEIGFLQSDQTDYICITDIARFKNEAGYNHFVLSPKKWIEHTNAVGLQSKSGGYGGTYAHVDIALEFASWVSVEFKF
jgi:hypothetical protein